MKIENVNIKGFKNYKEVTSFELGKHTIIYGENYQGKTSIGEAIMWCLTGCDLTGNNKADTRLINNESKEMEVEIKFVDNMGNNRKLSRKKKGSVLTLKLDNKKITQKELEEYIDKDIFLVIYNPNYFGSLSPKKAREMITRYLPEVKTEEVVKELGIENIKKYKDMDFSNPDNLLNELKNELNATEKEVERNKGKIELLKSNILDSELDITNKKSDITVYENLKLRTKDELLKEMEDRQAKLSDKLQNELINTESIEEELNSLKIEYRHLKNTLLKPELEDTKCPTCHQIIRAQAIDEHNKKLQNEIKKITAKGKALKEKLSNIVETNDKIKQVIEEEHKKEMQKIRKELVKSEEYEKIKAEIDMLISKLNKDKNTLNEIEKSNTIMDQEIKELKEKIEVIKTYIRTYVGLQAKYLNSNLNRTKIQLYKIVKSTGEKKEDFRVTYDGKEYGFLSASERIRANLEIADFLNKITGLNYPVFLDNAESITHYIKPNCQVIEARVEKGSSLNIEILEK